MKLKDYLKQFEGIDPEADVIHTMSVGCCGETETLEDPDVDRSYSKTDNYVHISFPPFDFLNTCRKYSSKRTPL